MFASKPIIGISGGIGSGKTYVARLFGALGCCVIISDEQVREVYRSDAVKRTLKEWWGDAVFDIEGEINRSAVAKLVFQNPAERTRLEQLLHPLVNKAREHLMQACAGDAQVLAFVWDTPLLFETGLDRQCDVLVFVDAPWDVRLSRVLKTRDWSETDLLSREKLQMPLDKKRKISDYVLSNTAGTDQPIDAQVREVLSRILAVD